MKINTKAIKNLVIAVYSLTVFLYPSINCQADNNTTAVQKIAGYIVEYNAEQIRLSDSNKTYRGEEGILFIKPEEALKLGLKVYTDQDYNDAVALFEKAADALEAAEKALSYRGNREPEHAVIQKIISNILLYKENSLLAKEKLVNYRKNLDKDQDDRFNPEICNRLIITILNEDLNETGNNLRDTLACFYNRCHSTKHGSHFLAPENIRFVNSLFNRFIAQASPEEISLFNMDKNSRNGNGSDYGDWKKVVNKEVPEFLPVIESALEKGGSIYRTDPLLFLALMKKESSFRPRAVSYVGAAGLTQLMPQTALDLGLKEIYMPDYYKKAGELSRTEREMRAKARQALLSISKRDDTQAAKQAREHINKSINAGEKRKELLKKYKKELADGKNDDRFDAQKVIEAGYTYFTRLMKSNNGDISLALASYNAGQHRVKEFDGLPPFSETIGFRNLILQYYSEYLEELKD
ncbi:MAG: transglycosylase SLT domain-containing protein [Deltaproteobacteria bacterium]|nr:transglycosylase SLT domain-containing protein [Deltaproteobacteria bacterium]